MRHALPVRLLLYLVCFLAPAGFLWLTVWLGVGVLWVFSVGIAVFLVAENPWKDTKTAAWLYLLGAAMVVIFVGYQLLTADFRVLD